MISKALVKRVRLSPQKARVVAKNLRGTKIELAVDNLKFSNTKASKIILKVLNQPSLMLSKILLLTLIF